MLLVVQEARNLCEMRVIPSTAGSCGLYADFFFLAAKRLGLLSLVTMSSVIS